LVSKQENNAETCYYGNRKKAREQLLADIASKKLT
jgi:hypothetical protein